MKKATADGLIVAGLRTEDANIKNVYRDPQTMNASKQIWTLYFPQPNATVSEFGETALLGALSY